MSQYVFPIFVSGSAEQTRRTGSFTKLVAIQTGSLLTNISSSISVFTRVEFGLYNGRNSSSIYEIYNRYDAKQTGTIGGTNAGLVLLPGDTLEGPIVQFAMISGSCLAYKGFNKK